MDTIQQSVDAFEALMFENQTNVLEELNRLSKGEIFVLTFLSRQNRPTIPSDISEAMHTSTARISAIMGTLEKKGQITREIDKLNRRNILVTITDEGAKRIEGFAAYMRNRLTAVLTEMGEQDAETFVRLFKRFHGIFKRMMSCPFTAQQNPPDG